MGKGDKRRPREVTKAAFDSNWDRIFGRGRYSTEEPVRDSGPEFDSQHVHSTEVYSERIDE